MRTTATFFGISMVLVAPVSAQMSACDGGDMPFDVRTEATWRIAPEQRFQLIANMRTPALYEVCRNGVNDPWWVELTTDLGVIVGPKLAADSCAVVYGKRIGILVDDPMGRQVTLAGTYRRIGEEEIPVFTDQTRFQAQATFVGTKSNLVHVAAMTTQDSGQFIKLDSVYRLCLDHIFEGELTEDFLTGVSVHVDGTPLNKEPVSRDSAIFGSGACVDFEGADIWVQMDQTDPAELTYKACGAVAFGPQYEETTE